MNNDTRIHVLLVDDDPDFINDFRILLPPHIVCTVASSTNQADVMLQEIGVDVVFLDIDLGTGGNGMNYLKQLKRDNPYLPVIMISADQQIQTVVRAIQMGASDYVGKSPDLEKLRLAIDRAIEENRLRHYSDLLESQLNERFDELIGESDSILGIKAEMMRLAEVNSNVLITGDSGTGKELVAGGIHRLAYNKKHPFIAVNCPALAQELIESEMFGHEKGAFTGATTRRLGKFEHVGEGTLFLDEITEVPVHIQAKLLRVLQEREFERIGGSRLLPFRGRILASTNRDIDKALAEGKLREDLYYRLNVVRLHLPPLRDRREDIPLLIVYFIRHWATEMKKPVPDISDDAVKHLCDYTWPGNVRELSNCIENTIVHSQNSVLTSADFERCIIGSSLKGTYEEAKRAATIHFQRGYIKAALERNDYNLSKTARDINLTRQGIIKIMKASGLWESEQHRLSD